MIDDVPQKIRTGRLPGLVIYSGLILAVVGCGGEHASDPAGSGEPPVQTRMESPEPMDLTQQTEFARAELARRLGVEAEELRLLEAEQVHWPDSSLGCPLPDRGYTQVITPGALIRFAHGKVVYEYHAGRSGEPFLCEPPATIQPPAAVGPPVRGFDDGT